MVRGVIVRGVASVVVVVRGVFGRVFLALWGGVVRQVRGQVVPQTGELIPYSRLQLLTITRYLVK